ncbi:hypothetical protein GCM10028807_45850 [Spirosoma daeguense]
MERYVTILVAGICAAPLGFFLAGWSFLSDNRGNSDQTIANGYAGILLGIVGAIVSFAVTLYLTNNLIAKGYLRQIQLVDVLMIIGWGVALFIVFDNQPRLLNYVDHNPILEVDVRVKKSQLKDSIDKAVEVMFSETSLTYYRTEQIRNEDNSVILPWFGYLYRVKDWQVRVYLHNQPADFQMNLPRRPTESTEWSGWIEPMPNPAEKAPDGLTIRYRFRLVPYTQDP